MKLAISNLAWDETENDKVVRLLHQYKISAIEVACSKVKDLKKYRKFWDQENIKVVAITSLLFGHPELTLFENAKTRNQTLEHLKHQADLANQLGAKIMMFGSPKNRIKEKLTNEETLKISRDFFTKLCDYTSQFEISLAFEPNPPIYGGDFIHTTQEAIELAEFINHPCFGINLDASTVASNQENYNQSVKAAIPFAKHAHISEPFLKPIPNGQTNHQAFSQALKKHSYKNWLSIEMPLGPDIDHLQQIESTLQFATSVYN